MNEVRLSVENEMLKELIKELSQGKT
jgi:hypothetical protein